MFLVTKCGIFLGVLISKELPIYISNFLFYGNSSCAFNIQDAFAAYVYLPSSLSAFCSIQSDLTKLKRDTGGST